MSESWLGLRWPDIHMPRKSANPLDEWLEKNLGHKGKPTTEGREYAYMQAHKDAVDQKARMAEFQAAQKGAPQSYTGEIGKPFSTSKYKSTAMFPSKSMPVSDPGRLQAAPVGYEKEPWWRQSPYVSPRQPGYSIFSMKPYSW